MLSTKNLEKLIRGYITKYYLSIKSKSSSHQHAQSLESESNYSKHNTIDIIRNNDDRNPKPQNTKIIKSVNNKHKKNNRNRDRSRTKSITRKRWNFPQSLDLMIVAFCGESMFLRFDIYLDTFGYMIKDNGRLIKTPTTPTLTPNSSNDSHTPPAMTNISFNTAGMSELSTVVTALSNVGWSSGIHEFKVKAIKPGKDAIGITSSLDEIMAWVWIKQSRNYTHYYYGGGSISSSTNAVNKYNAVNADEWIWKKDDVLTVKVDLFVNELTFYMNDELMGESFEIEPNCTWYPIVCVQENNTEYRLIR
mmetsp:Transcript_28677/g.25340  ORF Transcript_28677/g.25340 Transcript_28677/m.25340 type:complete len:306 (-) Transcript_28677:367-1284(-)